MGDELSALGRQFLAAASELPASSIDVAPASLHLVQVEEPGLVEASKAATFGIRGVEPPFEMGELGGQDLVVGGG